MTSKLPLYDLTRENGFMDDSTVSYENQEIKATQTSYPIGGPKYQITSLDTDSYFDLYDSHLWVDYKIETGGSPSTNLDQAHVQDPWAFFNSARLYVNSVLVGAVEGGCDLVHTMTQLVESGAQHQKTVGQKSHWYPLEKADGAADLDPAVLNTDLLTDGNFPTGSRQHKVQIQVDTGAITDTFENPNYEDNFARQVVNAASTNQTAMLPLRELFGFCKDFGRVIRGSKIELVLTKQQDEAAFYSGVADATFHVQNVSLWLRRVRPSLAMEARLNAQLSSGKMVPIRFSDPELYVNSDIPASTIANRFIVTQSSARINRIYVGFSFTANRSNIRRNPLQFEAMNVTHLHARINGVQYPLEEYRLSEEGLVRALNDVHEIAIKNGVPAEDSLIDNVTFSTTRRIYCIDVSAQDETYDSSRTQNVEIRYRMSSAPAANYDLNVILVKEKVVGSSLVNGSLKIIQK